MAGVGVAVRALCINAQLPARRCGQKGRPLPAAAGAFNGFFIPAKCEVISIDGHGLTLVDQAGELALTKCFPSFLQQLAIDVLEGRFAPADRSRVITCVLIVFFHYDGYFSSLYSIGGTGRGSGFFSFRI